MTWKIGDTSRKYEVGPRGGPTTVSTGRGDRGGVSYGTYQLSSKTGTCAKFVKMMGYSQYFGNNQPGTAAFSALWVQAPKKFPAFGEDQHKFILKTHFQVQCDYLKSVGIDLSNHGPAVMDSIWSTSVQFGGNTSLIEKALKGRQVSGLSDEEVVTAIQDYKVANNTSLFKSSSPAVRESTLKRAKAEKTDLIALAKETQESNVPPGLKELFDAISEIGKV